MTKVTKGIPDIDRYRYALRLEKNNMEAFKLQFNVPAVPIAQPRQRHTIRFGHVVNYTPQNNPVNAYKATVRTSFNEVYKHAPLEGPVTLDLVFVLPRPESMIWKRKPMPREPHTSKPDRDNLEKATMDALNKLAWRDDSQVCDGRVSKVIASGYEQPHVEITITAQANQPEFVTNLVTLTPEEHSKITQGGVFD